MLHPALASSCTCVGTLPLSILLLSDDANYPWTLLVPARIDIQEIYQLSKPDQNQLLDESTALADAMQVLFAADKLNVATIGNKVPQLHVHHIARYRTDRAWPDPVWGAFESVARTDTETRRIVEDLRQAMTDRGMPWSPTGQLPLTQ